MSTSHEMYSGTHVGELSFLSQVEIELVQNITQEVISTFVILEIPEAIPPSTPEGVHLMRCTHLKLPS